MYDCFIKKSSPFHFVYPYERRFVCLSRYPFICHGYFFLNKHAKHVNRIHVARPFNCFRWHLVKPQKGRHTVIENKQMGIVRSVCSGIMGSVENQLKGTLKGQICIFAFVGISIKQKNYIK